jgi:hypothetical protein
MPVAGAPAMGDLETNGEFAMTATTFNSIRIRATAEGAPLARRTRHRRTGASQEFRSLVAEFDARARAGREDPGGAADAQIRPRHVIAAEGILARMRERLATAETPSDDVGNDGPRRGPAGRLGPVHTFRAAKRIVLSGLDRVDYRLQRTLRRHGFDRLEVAKLSDAVMSGIPYRAELALNHLPLAPRPLEAAKHLFDNALDKIAGNLADALRRNGLGRDRIAEILHIVTTGIDECVEAALDGLAKSWSRPRGIAGTT